MDYGWQNLEQAGRNDSLKSLASNEDGTEHAAPPQTSNMRDVLSPVAMMISLQLPFDASAILGTRRKAMQSFSCMGRACWVSACRYRQ